MVLLSTIRVRWDHFWAENTNFVGSNEVDWLDGLHALLIEVNGLSSFRAASDILSTSDQPNSVDELDENTPQIVRHFNAKM